MKYARAATIFAAFLAPLLTRADSTLTILHFNDAESHLVAEDVSRGGLSSYEESGKRQYRGGAAAFAALVGKLRAEATTDGVVTISAGDNFLCGVERDASDPKLNPANKTGIDYDALLFAAAKVDVAIHGNHDFDSGPETLTRFINAIHTGEKNAVRGFNTRFVACNLDASACPDLAAKLAPATVIFAGKLKIGVVGDVTGDLEKISNPSPVKTIDADGDGDSDLDDIAILVQRQIDRLTAAGIDKIILVSHLQSDRNDQALVRKLRGVDIAISGGGHERLGNRQIDTGDRGSDLLSGPYPLLMDEDGKPVADLDGVNVPVVVAGSYLDFVGRLVVTFDDKGRVVSAGGDTIPVITQGGARKHRWVYLYVEKPVEDFVRGQETKVVANSEVELDCARENVRSRETNFGDIVADAVLNSARDYALRNNLRKPAVAVINGGGIRASGPIPAGAVASRTIRDIVPFPNSVAIVKNVSPANFRAIAENMVASVEKLGGGFGQISGFRIVYDPTMEKGGRVIDIVLDDGTAVVRGGKIVEGAPNVDFATIDYLARGGDGYPFEKGVVDVGVTEWRAVSDYLEKTLGGKIAEKAYPEKSSGRISVAIMERNCDERPAK